MLFGRWYDGTVVRLCRIDDGIFRSTLRCRMYNTVPSRHRRRLLRVPFACVMYSYGFDPHDDSDLLTIHDNLVYDNAWHGEFPTRFRLFEEDYAPN